MTTKSIDGPLLSPMHLLWARAVVAIGTGTNSVIDTLVCPPAISRSHWKQQVGPQNRKNIWINYWTIWPQISMMHYYCMTLNKTTMSYQVLSIAWEPGRWEPWREWNTEWGWPIGSSIVRQKDHQLCRVLLIDTGHFIDSLLRFDSRTFDIYSKYQFFVPNSIIIMTVKYC